MRTTSKLLVLACAFSATTLWGQEAAAPPAPPTNDEGSVTQSTPAPVAQNPMHQEDDATPQSATQSTEDTPAPPAVTATEPQGAQAAPPEPKSQTAEGKVLSQDATTLVVETSSGNRLRLTIDADTAIPSDLKVEDAVTVEYLALNDGSLRATRVAIAHPKAAEAAPVAEQAQTPPPVKPAHQPTAPKKAVTTPPTEPVSTALAAESVQTPAVVPAAPATSAAPVVADPVTSGASSETGAPVASTAASSATADLPAAATTTASSTRAPWSSRMIFPLLLLASGIAFIAVLGVRQARHAA